MVSNTHAKDSLCIKGMSTPFPLPSPSLPPLSSHTMLWSTPLCYGVHHCAMEYTTVLWSTSLCYGVHHYCYVYTRPYTSRPHREEHASTSRRTYTSILPYRSVNRCCSYIFKYLSTNSKSSVVITCPLSVWLRLLVRFCILCYYYVLMTVLLVMIKLSWSLPY